MKELQRLVCYSNFWSDHPGITTVFVVKIQKWADVLSLFLNHRSELGLIPMVRYKKRLFLLSLCPCIKVLQHCLILRRILVLDKLSKKKKVRGAENSLEIEEKKNAEKCEDESNDRKEMKNVSKTKRGAPDNTKEESKMGESSAVTTEKEGRLVFDLFGSSAG